MNRLIKTKTNSFVEVATIAALLHDIGKSNQAFQSRLIDNLGGGDYYRHEWLSLKIFISIIKECRTDIEWLALFASLSDSDNKLPCDAIIDDIFNQATTKEIGRAGIDQLPPLAQFVAWLIVTHHRLPPSANSQSDKPARRKAKLMSMFDFYTSHDASVSNLYGIMSAFDDWQKNPIVLKKNPARAAKSWQFDCLILESASWRTAVSAAAQDAINNPCLFTPAKEPVFTDTINNPYLSYMCRLTVMLSDHNYSSLSADDARNFCGDYRFKGVCANTDPLDHSIKQSLDAHLIGVGAFTTKLTTQLPSILSSLPRLKSNHALSRPTASKDFYWQNYAYNKARDINAHTRSHGFFGVNLASTGCGKTIGNARIMAALNDDNEGVRLTVALGLRVLTLQTGQQFRENLALSDKEAAIIVGGDANRELYELNDVERPSLRCEPLDNGSESSASIFTQNLDSTLLVRDYEHIETVLHDDKANQMLLSPVVTCTIDHLMQASEGLRGGGYIAPALRILSSDIILDEPDDFSVDDLYALSRLVYTIGMLGSRVLLSSATLTPSIVYFLFDAYSTGRQHYNSNNGLPAGDDLNVPCLFVDERECTPMSVDCSNAEQLKFHYDNYVEGRKRYLDQLASRRIARVLDLPAVTFHRDMPEVFFGCITQSIVDGAIGLHHLYSEFSDKYKKSVSIGLVRIANTIDLVAIAKSLVGDINVPDDTHIHFCCYHSRQVLALRSELECNLDEVLNRKDGKSLFDHQQIRDALDKSPAKNHIFIVLATSVSEVGRDHDYDFIIAEPSSMRSIIQLAGRLWRHRPHKVAVEPNLLILQYNLNYFTQKSRRRAGKPLVFGGLGFETKECSIESYDIHKIIDGDTLNKIDSRCRIVNNGAYTKIASSLSQLEHNRLSTALTLNSLCVANARWHTTSPMYRLCTDIVNLTPFRESLSTDIDWVVRASEDELGFYFAKDVDLPPHSQSSQNHLINHTVFDSVNPAVSKWLGFSVSCVTQKLADTFNLTSNEYVENRYMTATLKSRETNIWQYNEFLGFYINYNLNSF